MNISLNAFIKLYALDMPKQMAEISRRLQQGSGYDFYKTLNSAIKAYIENKTNDEIDIILNSPTNPIESYRNRLAFESFEKKFGNKRKNLSYFSDKKKFVLENKFISIIVSPTFCLETSKGMEAYNVWATQKPPVNMYMAGISCHICQESFRKTSLSNYKFKFFDAVGGKVHSRIPNNISLIINQTAKNISDLANIINV